MGGQHDQVFFKILSEEGVMNFLDAIFGFLCRCSDYYVETDAKHKLGFPPGDAEKLVMYYFRKWKNFHDVPLQQTPSQSPESTLSLQNVEESPVNCTDHEEEIEKNREQLSDSYNGAIRNNYTWSQKITDLDIQVKIPKCIKSVKELNVIITADDIKVAAKSSILRACNPSESNRTMKLEDSAIPEWTTLLEGRFIRKIRKEESIWSFIPGQHITILLEKAVECWWNALLEGEPKIELTKIDCSRNFNELGNVEQMKIQELMWTYNQKIHKKRGICEKSELEEFLKQAWNMEGSPFKGTEYNPSILKTESFKLPM